MLWWNACFFNAPSPLTIHRTCLIRPERTTTSTLEPCFLRQHLNGCSRDVHRTNPPSNTHIIILDVHDQSWSYNMDIAPWAFGIAVANPTIFWSFFRVKLGLFRYSIVIYWRHAPKQMHIIVMVQMDPNGHSFYEKNPTVRVYHIRVTLW
jgi:hypothetical protein